MQQAEQEKTIAAVRHFNRFYTQHIGILQKELLQSPFSLVECRVLRELAFSGETTATFVGKRLEIDRGYLSRILRSFSRRRLIRSTANKADGRQKFIQLTRRGEAAHAAVHARAQRHAGLLVAGLTLVERKRLLTAMRTIEQLLRGGSEEKSESYKADT